MPGRETSDPSKEVDTTITPPAEAEKKPEEETAVTAETEAARQKAEGEQKEQAELANKENQIDLTRQDYISQYQGYLKANKNVGVIKSIRQKISGLFGGDKDKDTMADHEACEYEAKMHEAHEKYVSSKKEFAVKSCELKRAELEKTGLSPEEVDAQMELFLQKEIFDKLVVGEENLLFEAKASTFPPKEQGPTKQLLSKALEKWSKLGTVKRTLITATLVTGVVAVGGGFSAPAVALFAGYRVARGLTAAATGMMVGKGIDKLLTWDIKRDMENKDKELDVKKNSMKVEDLESLSKEYRKQMEYKAKRERNKLLLKAGAMMAAGLGAAQGAMLLEKSFLGTGGMTGALKEMGSEKVPGVKPPETAGGSWVLEKQIKELQVQADEAQRLAAEQAEASKEIFSATVEKGGSYERSFREILEQNPEKFGYSGDLEDAADIHKWSGGEAHRIALSEHLVKADGSEVRIRNIGGMVSLEIDENGKPHLIQEDVKTYEYKPGPSKAEIAAQQKDFDETKIKVEAEKSELLKEREELGVVKDKVEAYGRVTKDIQELEADRATFDDQYGRLDHEIPKGMKNYDVIGKVGGKEFSAPSDYAHIDEAEDYLKLWQKNWDSFHKGDLKDFYTTSGDDNAVTSYAEVEKDFNKQLEAFRAHVEAGKDPEDFKAEAFGKLTKKKLEALVDTKMEAQAGDIVYKPSVYPDEALKIKGEQYFSKAYQKVANYREAIRMVYDEDGKLKGFIGADQQPHLHMPKGGWPKGVKTLVEFQKSKV